MNKQRRKGGTWVYQTNRGKYIIKFNQIGEMRRPKKIKMLLKKYETEKIKGMKKQCEQTRKGLQRLGIITKKCKK